MTTSLVWHREHHGDPVAREVRLRRAGDCGGGGNGTQHPAPYPPHPCHTLTLGCLWPGPAQPAHPNLFISGLIVTMSISAAHLTPHNILCCVLNTCITILHREWWLDVWCLATLICRYSQISTGLAMFTSSGAGAICCSVTTQWPSGRHIYTRQICELWHLWRGLVTRDAGRDTLIMSSGCTNLFLILTWIQFTLRRLLSKCSTVSSRCSPHKSSGAWQPSYQDCSWCYCQHVTTCVQTAGTWLVLHVNCSDTLISYSLCTHSIHVYALFI